MILSDNENGSDLRPDIHERRSGFCHWSGKLLRRRHSMSRDARAGTPGRTQHGPSLFDAMLVLIDRLNNSTSSHVLEFDHAKCSY